MNIINYIMHVPAGTWYHLAAFVLTGAGAQYTVQLVKVIARNKFGKGILRFLNGSISTLYVALGAFTTGGIALGNLTKTSAAVATLSVLIYRFHDSFLYKSAQNVVDTATATDAVPAHTVVFTPSDKFTAA